jgi:flagellar biosynthetic protein FlhB
MKDYSIDLQLFSEDKKEPATPRRRQMARDRGQIVQSRDLISSVGFMAGVIALKFCINPIASFLTSRCRDLWAMQPPAEPNVQWALTGIRSILLSSLVAVAPIIVAIGTLGIFTSVAQSGMGVNFSLLQPEMQRINPLEGLKRLFSRKSLMQLFQSMIKVSLIALVAYSTLRGTLPQISASIVRELPVTITLTKGTIEKVAINCGAFLVILGALDYIYQWWENERSMMMTTRELREELKDTEIKPEVRSAIRRRQRATARRRMMQEIPTADVVIVNPTHYAVALRYEMEKDIAPIVVAKGMDNIALRIREIAQENNVSVVTDPPLARSLFRATDIGEPIPEELFKAVAEVLAYVYRVSGKRRAPVEKT